MVAIDGGFFRLIASAALHDGTGRAARERGFRPQSPLDARLFWWRGSPPGEAAAR